MTLRIGAFIVFATAALAVAVAFANGDALLATYSYVLVLGVVAALALSRRIGQALPETIPFERLLGTHPSAASHLQEFDTLRRRLQLAAASESEMGRYLRPLLRQVAATRLARTYGIRNLDQEPNRARTLLGDQLWAIVRPDWQPVRAPFHGGATEDELEQLIRSLERI